MERKGGTKHQELWTAVSTALNHADPIGLHRDGASSAEYDQEVDAILQRLRGVTSVKQLEEIIHEEFVRWFGLERCGDRVDYREQAEEIWLVLEALGPG